MRIDNKSIIAVVVLVIFIWIAFRLLKALLPLILLAGAAFFLWRWYRQR